MVEGHGQFFLSFHAGTTNFDNPRHGHGQIAQNDLCWDAQGSDALRAEEGGASRILAGNGSSLVGKAVNLDSEPGRCAIEVQNVDSRRMLAAEFKSTRPQP
jgi:hypothetical protein